MEDQQPGPSRPRSGSASKSRDRSKEIERQRLRRQTKTQAEKDADNAARRTAYASLPTAVHEERLADRRTQYASLPVEQHLDLLAERREDYASMPLAEHQQFLANLRDRFAALSPTQHEEILSVRREEYARLPPEQHQNILSVRREEYASLPPEQHQNILASRRHEYANLPPEQHQNILASRRDDYANLPPAQHQQQLAVRRNRPQAVVDAENRRRRAEYLKERLLQVEAANAELLTTRDGAKYGKVYFKAAWKQDEFRCDGRTIVKYFNVGQRTVECPHCHALFYKDPTTQTNDFFKCCKRGQINFPLPKTTYFLFKLFTGQHEFSANFLENIRSINAALSLACTGYKRRDLPGHGPYCFTIQGAMSYLLYDLKPGTAAPVYNQTWILDPMEATAARVANPANADVDPLLFTMLHEMLAASNPLCKLFKFVYDQGVQRRDDFRIVFRNRNADQQYDQPTGDSIAALYGDNETDDTERGVICFVKTSAEEPSVAQPPIASVSLNHFHFEFS